MSNNFYLRQHAYKGSELACLDDSEFPWRGAFEEVPVESPFRRCISDELPTFTFAQDRGAVLLRLRIEMFLPVNVVSHLQDVDQRKVNEQMDDATHDLIVEKLQEDAGAKPHVPSLAFFMKQIDEELDGK